MERDDLRGAVALSHFLLGERVKPGDRVADATCGNGNDTLYLARLVGPNGKVFAFDIQEQALVNTRTLLAGSGCLAQTELIAAGHERIAEFVRGPLKAVAFNLGYLPGSDKRVVTRPEETVAALDQVARLLLPGGIITVCVYTGHPGGELEAESVVKWGAALPSADYNVWLSRRINLPPTAPYLVIVDKMKQI